MNHAIATLRSKRHELTEGLDSISQQEKTIELLRERLERAEGKLVDSELALEQIDAALGALAVFA